MKNVLTQRLGSILQKVFFAILLLGEGIEAVAKAQNRETDLVCGARCVWYLLEKYHAEDRNELFDVVSDLQASITEKGISLQVLASYIEENGLFVYAVKLPVMRQLRGDLTAIVHVFDNERNGHYLVSEVVNGQRRYWGGLEGYYDEFPTHYKLSGVFLVVSKEPMQQSDLSELTHSAVFWAIGILVLGTTCLYFVCWHRFIFRSNGGVRCYVH